MCEEDAPHGELAPLPDGGDRDQVEDDAEHGEEHVHDHHHAAAVLGLVVSRVPQSRHRQSIL